MIQEDRVHRLAHGIVAAEGEGDVRDAARDAGAGEGFLDDPGRLEEIDGVMVVLLDARGDGQYVRVEDDVLRRETRAVDQETVGAGADADFLIACRGLALLIKGHHHRGGTIAAQERGAAQELLLPVLERDRVHDALALQALQARLEHGPLRAVQHDRHARDVGLDGDQVEELHHRGLAVDQGLVDVDVDHHGPVVHLLAGDLEGGVPVGGLDGLRKFR